jgi:hypothetical protein
MLRALRSDPVGVNLRTARYLLRPLLSAPIGDVETTLASFTLGHRALLSVEVLARTIHTHVTARPHSPKHDANKT